MKDYILFESRDAFESADLAHTFSLATSLARAGSQVTMFLVQNGVLPSRRRSTASSALTNLAADGVEILADEFSLTERGIDPNELAPGVQAAQLEVAVDRLARGCAAIWH